MYIYIEVFVSINLYKYLLVCICVRECTIIINASLSITYHIM